MTPAQRIHLMADLWPAAAEAQHWPVNDRCKRLEVLGKILNRDLPSASAITSNADYTLVKNALLHLANRLGPSDPNATRREKVSRQLKCLALYLDPERPFRPLIPYDDRLRRAQAYATAIIHDAYRRAGYEPATFGSAPFDDLLAELSAEDLQRLVMTLDNRLHNQRTGFRVKSGHTLHEMFLLAGLPCHCRDCLPTTSSTSSTPSTPVPAANCPF